MRNKLSRRKKTEKKSNFMDESLDDFDIKTDKKKTKKTEDVKDQDPVPAVPEVPDRVPDQNAPD